MSKRPTSQERVQSLNVPHFGESQDMQPGDPLETTPMVVRIDWIREYDHNPRRERNAAYDEIRESIQSQGLKQPLVITRRPGDQYYIIKHGGNTRLRILNELYQETHDDRFAEVHCLYEPWGNEAGILIDHLIENDTRGDLTLIDKARAVNELRTLLEQDANESLSQRELAERLQQRGYRLSQSLLSQMDYALTTLWPAIPQALRAGLGKHQIERIRKLDKAISDFQTSREQGAEQIDAMRQEFIGCLSRFDAPNWDLSPVKDDMVARIAENLDEEISKVRLDLESLLHSRRPGPDAETSNPLASPRRHGSPRKTSTGSAKPVSDQHPLDTPHAEADKADSQTTSDYGDTRQSQKPSGASQSGDDSTDDSGVVLPSQASSGQRPHTADESTSSLPADFKSLRGRMWTLATRLARRNHLQECILPINQGPGFLVDLPAMPLIEDPDANDPVQGHVPMVWWCLAAVNEQFICKTDALRHLLPEDARLHELIRAYDDGGHETDVLDPLLGRVGMEWLGLYLFSRLTDAELKDLIDLIETSRHMHTLCEAQEKEFLWEV